MQNIYMLLEKIIYVKNRYYCKCMNTYEWGNCLKMRMSNEPMHKSNNNKVKKFTHSVFLFFCFVWSGFKDTIILFNNYMNCELIQIFRLYICYGCTILSNENSLDVFLVYNCIHSLHKVLDVPIQIKNNV